MEVKINNCLWVVEQLFKIILIFVVNFGIVVLLVDFGGLCGLFNELGIILCLFDYFVLSQFDSVFCDLELCDLLWIYMIWVQNLEIKLILSEEISFMIIYYCFVLVLCGEVGGMNWLLDCNFDIYFVGSMYYVYSFYSNVECVGQWFGFFEVGMEVLEDVDWNDCWSGLLVIFQFLVIEGVLVYLCFCFQGCN